PHSPPLFPYTTLFRSDALGPKGDPQPVQPLLSVGVGVQTDVQRHGFQQAFQAQLAEFEEILLVYLVQLTALDRDITQDIALVLRSEEHTSELQSRENL